MGHVGVGGRTPWLALELEVGELHLGLVNGGEGVVALRGQVVDVEVGVGWLYE